MSMVHHRSSHSRARGLLSPVLATAVPQSEGVSKASGAATRTEWWRQIGRSDSGPAASSEAKASGLVVF